MPARSAASSRRRPSSGPSASLTMRRSSSGLGGRAVARRRREVERPAERGPLHEGTTCTARHRTGTAGSRPRDGLRWERTTRCAVGPGVEHSPRTGGTAREPPRRAPRRQRRGAPLPRCAPGATLPRGRGPAPGPRTPPLVEVRRGALARPKARSSSARMAPSPLARRPPVASGGVDWSRSCARPSRDGGSPAVPGSAGRAHGPGGGRRDPWLYLVGGGLSAGRRDPVGRSTGSANRRPAAHARTDRGSRYSGVSRDGAVTVHRGG